MMKFLCVNCTKHLPSKTGPATHIPRTYRCQLVKGVCKTLLQPTHAVTVPSGCWRRFVATSQHQRFYE